MWQMTNPQDPLSRLRNFYKKNYAVLMRSVVKAGPRGLTSLCSPQVWKKLLHLKTASARWTRHGHRLVWLCGECTTTSVPLRSLIVSEPVSFAIYKKKLLFLPCWNYWIKSYFYKFVMNWIMTILRIKFLEKKSYELTISIWSVMNWPNVMNLPQDRVVIYIHYYKRNNYLMKFWYVVKF